MNTEKFAPTPWGGFDEFFRDGQKTTATIFISPAVDEFTGYVPAHKHKKLKETVRLVSGQGIIFIDDERYDLTPDNEVVINPGKSHVTYNSDLEEPLFIEVDCTPPYDNDDIQETPFPHSFILYRHAQYQADPSHYYTYPILLGS